MKSFRLRLVFTALAFVLVIALWGCEGGDRIIGKDGAMLLIPAGEFQMGDHGGFDTELPVHTIYVDDFYIDKYEVTNAQYSQFVQETGHREPEGLGPVNGEWQDGFKPWSDSTAPVVGPERSGADPISHR